MGQTTRHSLTVLAAAALLGIVGETVRAVPLGINVLIWTVSLVAAAAALARRLQISLTGEGRWFVAPLLFFAAAFAWRDSPTLQVMNGLAVLLTLSLAGLYSRAGQVRAAGLLDFLMGALMIGVHAGVGLFHALFEEIQWKEIPRGRWSETALGIARGALIALPLLLLFGSLFMAADPVFERLIHRVFDWDVEQILTRGFGLWCCFMVAAGMLQAALVTRPWWAPRELKTDGTVGMTEVGTALGMLNVLFLMFVAVQFSYFFGGDARVQLTPGLTYADYARRGFFELVTVAALILPVLLSAHWLVQKELGWQRRTFGTLAGGIVGLLFVIMASALHRMAIYYQAYGLTELRLYTTVFMLWLAIVFLWFAITVLRSRRERFAIGAMMAALAVVALLNRLNPDAFIVNANVARIGSEKLIDVSYITSLSADAVPGLVEARPSLTEAQRADVGREVLARWSEGTDDWRTWNWSRWQARQTIAERAAVLQARRSSLGPPNPTAEGQE
jgi:hypothetical protein